MQDIFVEMKNNRIKFLLGSTFYEKHPCKEDDYSDEAREEGSVGTLGTWRGLMKKTKLANNEDKEESND